MNTIKEKPKVLDEIILQSNLTSKVYGTVTVAVTDPATPLLIGTVLTTKDGGATWHPLTSDIYSVDNAPFTTDDEVFHNGHIWKSLADANAVEPETDPAKWEDQGEWNANGVLCENLEETGKASVLVSGNVREKHLQGYDSSMAHSMFKNKIYRK